MLTVGQHYICFRKGSAVSIRTTIVNTPVGTIKFYIILANTPFLFCIKDMDDLNVRLDNTRNVLVKNETKIVPVIRKYGHPWIILNNSPKTIAWCHLTES